MGAAVELQLHVAPHTHTCEGHPVPSCSPRRWQRCGGVHRRLRVGAVGGGLQPELELLLVRREMHGTAELFWGGVSGVWAAALQRCKAQLVPFGERWGCEREAANPPPVYAGSPAPRKSLERLHDTHQRR